MSEPNFFIIGAPKCGTTALSLWLGENPHIYMSPVKEPHYYNADLNNRQARTKKEYEALFKGAEGYSAIGEASVWYLYSREAIDNIFRDNKNAKFIVCLRNPVEMAYSLHSQHVVSVNEDIMDFAKAWYAQEQRRNGKMVPPLCEEPEILQYGRVCSLGDQVSRLLKKCDRSKLHFVLLDDLVRDPRSVYLGVEKFLEVPDDGREEFPVVNGASQRRWPALARVMRRVSRIRRVFRIPRLGTGVMTWLDVLNRKEKARVSMDDEMREVLVRYFRDDISVLGDLIGRDLSSWNN